MSRRDLTAGNCEAQERRNECLSQGADGRNTDGEMNRKICSGISSYHSHIQKVHTACGPRAQTLEPHCVGQNSSSAWL